MKYFKIISISILSVIISLIIRHFIYNSEMINVTVVILSSYGCAYPLKNDTSIDFDYCLSYIVVFHGLLYFIYILYQSNNNPIPGDAIRLVGVSIVFLIAIIYRKVKKRL